MHDLYRIIRCMWTDVFYPFTHQQIELLYSRNHPNFDALECNKYYILYILYFRLWYDDFYKAFLTICLKNCLVVVFYFIYLKILLKYRIYSLKTPFQCIRTLTHLYNFFRTMTYIGFQSKKYAAIMQRKNYG